MYHNRNLLCRVVQTRVSVCESWLHCTHVISEKRAAEAKRILTKYPDRIPVIVEKSVRSTLPEIDKKKFLVPGSMLCGEFKYIIHKHLQSQLSSGAEFLSAEQTLYLFVKNTPPRTGMSTFIIILRYCILIGALMSELYEAFKDPDGFLYMTYSAENTLGRHERND